MDNIAIKDIEAATKTAAFVVRTYGDKYWPLFARLERELKDRRSRLERLSQYQ